MNESQRLPECRQQIVDMDKRSPHKVLDITHDCVNCTATLHCDDLFHLGTDNKKVSPYDKYLDEYPFKEDYPQKTCYECFYEWAERAERKASAKCLDNMLGNIGRWKDRHK